MLIEIDKDRIHHIKENEKDVLLLYVKCKELDENWYFIRVNFPVTKRIVKEAVKSKLQELLMTQQKLDEQKQRDVVIKAVLSVCEQPFEFNLDIK